MDTGTGESKLLTVACPNLTNCHTQNDELGFSREVAHLLALLLPQKKTRPLLAMAALLLGPAGLAWLAGVAGQPQVWQGWA